MDRIEIIDYRPELKEAFVNLNLEWIEKYFKVEQPDIDQLQNCEQTILARGGRIFLAQTVAEAHNTVHRTPFKDGEGRVVLGCCALEKVTDEKFELIKMAVSPAAQGQQIGKKLMLHAIDEARLMGVKILHLESNRRLIPALNLYRSVGFEEVPFVPSAWARADIQMVLHLS
jgi:ribosomal protein S18 acetylase RimI-like enzyme